MQEKTTTYSEAIEQAMNRYGSDAIVMTGGYDENIVDHWNEDRDDDRTVYATKRRIEHDNGQKLECANVLQLYSWTNKDGYDLLSSEPLATIISGDDYERLGY